MALDKEQLLNWGSWSDSQVDGHGVPRQRADEVSSEVLEAAR